MTGADSTSMLPDPPEPPQLVQTAAQGPWGGPLRRAFQTFAGAPAQDSKA